VQIFDNTLKTRFQSSIGKWMLKLLYGTNRWDIRGTDHYLSLLGKKQSVIISCWHGHLLAPFMHLSGKQYYGLVGTHRDGEIISRIGHDFGWRLLRGSSSKRGPEAFVEIVKILRHPPALVAITPDGPKGPPRIPKPGIIQAAKKTGAFIVPVAVHSTQNWTFVNWDTFYVEKPFGTIFMEYGSPILFDKKTDFEQCEQEFINEMGNTEHSNLQYANKQNI
jgi:lysophospholipid acyltransferase (LPLAT)-like uncharacterized protein|tara:strand:+ start:350 stop:1012 length:663 start_codon:yes stop_codon:yes gene_type:complete